jgi:hypothetical protein
MGGGPVEHRTFEHWAFAAEGRLVVLWKDLGDAFMADVQSLREAIESLSSRIIAIRDSL